MNLVWMLLLMLLSTLSINAHALHQAIEENKLKYFWKAVIKSKAEKINNQEHECNYTPLHHAIAHNKFDFVIVLLTHPLSNLDLVDQSKKSIEEMVTISPFIEDKIVLAVTSQLLKREEKKSIDFLGFLRIEDKLLNMPEGEFLAPIEAQISDEGRLTKILINFRHWVKSNVHKEETFLRLDDTEVLALTHFLLTAETVAPLRDRIQKIALKKYKIGKKIKENNVKKYEQRICDLLVAIKDIFQEHIEENRCLQRFLYSMRWISSKALPDDRHLVEDRIFSFVFFRLINKLLLESSQSINKKEKMLLIKSLQRTVSGGDEKCGDLQGLGEFFAAQNENGEQARLTLTVFRNLFY